jgi:hypothetical protein
LGALYCDGLWAEVASTHLSLDRKKHVRHPSRGVGVALSNRGTFYLLICNREEHSDNWCFKGDW